MNFTDRALEKIKSLRGDCGALLRVSIIGGGCSGLSYKLDFVGPGTITATDKVYDFSGMVVITDAKSDIFLARVEIDHDDGLNGQGFTFSNANASRTCGCGTSFST